MRARTALLASLLAVGSVAGIGHAAAKKPCQLVKDPAGDTFLARYQETAKGLGAPVPYGPQEDSLDILSADVASNAKTLTAVIRVKKLSTASTSPGGTSYDVNFTIPGAEFPLYVRAVLAAGAAPTFEAGYKEPIPPAVVSLTTLATKLADGTGIADPKTSEIRIHIPISAFSKQGKGLTPGTKLSLGEITAARYAGGRGLFADVVVATQIYKAGAVNCVTPGK
jgi:hypothetical protein